MHGWHLLMASSTKARLSNSNDRDFFLISIVPAVAYNLAALAAWAFAHRRSIKNHRVSLRSFLILVGVLSPGLAMLRWVYWPSIKL